MAIKRTLDLGMSAFWGKADLFHCPAKSPLIAISRHWDVSYDRAIWGSRGAKLIAGLDGKFGEAP